MQAINHVAEHGGMDLHNNHRSAKHGSVDLHRNHRLDEDFKLDLHNNHRVDDKTSWVDQRAILHAN
jgi:hypothetical protein